MRTLFKGGSVVTGAGARRLDLAVEGEKVVQAGRRLEGAFDQTVDVSGCLLFPGFIDAHTHFALDVAGTTTADDFWSGSRAALRGGTTTVIDFACPNKGESLQYGLDLWHNKADRRTFCDYRFHMTIDDWNESIRKELPAMFAAGVSSFKMYLTYPAMMTGDGEIYLAMKALKRLGGICGFHCENAGMIDAMIAERKAAGETGPASHPLTRPPIAEAEAVSRLLRIAQAAQCPVIIVHLTCEEALEEVETARRRGQQVYVETCPQYLTLDQSVYFQEDYSAAARYVCAPPLREKWNQDALWHGLRWDSIQTISTDHCSFTLEQKDRGREDFTRIPGGLPGVENRGELVYTCGVRRRNISLGRMCQVLCENPAKLYGLFPRKGQLAPGSDADIVVYHPGKKYDHTITAERSESRAGYSPYEGFPVSGGIRQVWLRGKLAVEDGAVLPDVPGGKFIARGKSAL
ncbi:MAG: dihydropyrimidinase [Oscillibacter sp.]|nr:dihydropyrimidinase [Oscillibacter sp.]